MSDAGQGISALQGREDVNTGDPPSVQRLRRSVSVPDIGGGIFIARDDDGTVLECALLAPLMRRVANDLAERPTKASWTMSFQPFEEGGS